MTGILAVFVSFTGYVLTHGALCRLRVWRRPSRLLNGLWLAFLPVYVICFLGLSRGSAVFTVNLRTANGVINVLNGLLIDVLLLIGYTAFFFLIERGLSLRVTIEINRATQRKMTLNDIARVYTYDYILHKRLGQMLEMGYWRKDGDYFTSTEKGRRFTAANQLVWRALRIGQD